MAKDLEIERARGRIQLFSFVMGSSEMAIHGLYQPAPSERALSSLPLHCSSPVFRRPWLEEPLALDFAPPAWTQLLPVTGPPHALSPGLFPEIHLFHKTVVSYDL